MGPTYVTQPDFVPRGFTFCLLVLILCDVIVNDRSVHPGGMDSLFPPTLIHRALRASVPVHVLPPEVRALYSMWQRVMAAQLLSCVYALQLGEHRAGTLGVWRGHSPPQLSSRPYVYPFPCSSMHCVVMMRVCDDDFSGHEYERKHGSGGQPLPSIRAQAVAPGAHCFSGAVV